MSTYKKVLSNHACTLTFDKYPYSHCIFCGQYYARVQHNELVQKHLFPLM